MEEWKKISGFSDYSVSNTGYVRRDTPTKRCPVPNKILKPGSGKKGHLYVNLRRDGCAHSKYIHRLVLEAFVGEQPEIYDCCAHNNGDTSDNRLENLRWATFSENSADSVRHGTSSRPGGTDHFRSKLNHEKINEARKMREDGLSFRSIAKVFGVSHNTIREAISGRSYKSA